MDRNDIQTRTREFVQRVIRGHQLADGDDIFATGFVNSMFAMQLVQFVETEFSVVVDDEDLEMDNFRSIDAITSLVERKTVSAGAA
jgi:methoxymalonate biosynthesis acyl carrier protein